LNVDPMLQHWSNHYAKAIARAPACRAEAFA
jgi:hypothetical protein